MYTITRPDYANWLPRPVHVPDPELLESSVLAIIHHRAGPNLGIEPSSFDILYHNGTQLTLTFILWKSRGFRWPPESQPPTYRLYYNGCGA